MEVVREYYEGVPLADWVFKSLSAGDIEEMSYAYDIHESEMQEIDGARIRVLKDVEIFDVSDVNWGMNPATKLQGLEKKAPGVKDSITLLDRRMAEPELTAEQVA